MLTLIPRGSFGRELGGGESVEGGLDNPFLGMSARTLGGKDSRKGGSFLGEGNVPKRPLWDPPETNHTGGTCRSSGKR